MNYTSVNLTLDKESKRKTTVQSEQRSLAFRGVLYCDLFTWNTDGTHFFSSPAAWVSAVLCNVLQIWVMCLGFTFNHVIIYP